MARITKEQKNYGEAMRHLIELYYRFEETDRKDWYSNQIIVLISKVFAMVFPNFRPCIYFRKYNLFRYGLPYDEIHVKRSDIEMFIAFMKAIRTDISSDRINLFQIQEPIVKNQNKLLLMSAEVIAKEITSDIINLESVKPCTIIETLDDETRSKYRRLTLMPPNRLVFSQTIAGRLKKSVVVEPEAESVFFFDPILEIKISF
jgi:hypothetical protein